jgi:hypothetical protein
LALLHLGQWTYSTSSLPIRSAKMIAPSRGIVTKNWLGTPF